VVSACFCIARTAVNRRNRRPIEQSTGSPNDRIALVTGQWKRVSERQQPLHSRPSHFEVASRLKAGVHGTPSEVRRAAVAVIEVLAVAVLYRPIAAGHHSQLTGYPSIVSHKPFVADFNVPIPNDGFREVPARYPTLDVPLGAI
jgi:hypothetical protein